MVVSSDEFNWNEKHKKTYFTYEQRKQLLEAIRYVDLVIPEKSWQQKRSDMHEYLWIPLSWVMTGRVSLIF